MKFELVSSFRQTGDQPEATQKLINGIERGEKYQVLLGVTGSGKTFTMANVIALMQKPALIISHNKTLAAQLTSEFQEYFPHNAVHYFVSYYDYYQPEAYVPQTDTYIEKETSINEEIDRLRHASTQALLTRKDVLIVASVSCIYALGDPEDYQKVKLNLKVGNQIKRLDILRHLTNLQYLRTNLDLGRGAFRVKGEILEIYPPYAQSYFQIRLEADKIENIALIDKLAQKTLSQLNEIDIYPAKHFLTSPQKLNLALQNIRTELEERIQYFLKQGKHLEAERLKQRTEFDLEMIEQTGYCNGVENYSRQLSFRKPDQAPTTLIGYFPKDFLMFIDESHITYSQIEGMYAGDRARKTTLIEYGFRLPSALDNRPLNIEEFKDKINQAIFVSATPAEKEIKLAARKNIVEQLLRPTGLLDPEVIIKPTKNQLNDLIKEIEAVTSKGRRVLVTTLTKRLAEELSEYLIEEGIKTHYLHSDIDTLERLEILRDLRLGVYDVVVGINLLREGLDLPEVSLVAILDADKEGYLRSATSLIQTMGRAARHKDGRVVMYADKITSSMLKAINETKRRRKIQENYNEKHGIAPKSIEKPIREDILSGARLKKEEMIDAKTVNPEEVPEIIKTLKNKMEMAVKNLEFEKAAIYRDQIIALRKKRW